MNFLVLLVILNWTSTFSGFTKKAPHRFPSLTKGNKNKPGSIFKTPSFNLGLFNNKKKTKRNGPSFHSPVNQVIKSFAKPVIHSHAKRPHSSFVKPLIGKFEEVSRL